MQRCASCPLLEVRGFIRGRKYEKREGVCGEEGAFARGVQWQKDGDDLKVVERVKNVIAEAKAAVEKAKKEAEEMADMVTKMESETRVAKNIRLSAEKRADRMEEAKNEAEAKAKKEADAKIAQIEMQAHWVCTKAELTENRVRRETLELVVDSLNYLQTADDKVAAAEKAQKEAEEKVAAAEKAQKEADEKVAAAEKAQKNAEIALETHTVEFKKALFENMKSTKKLEADLKAVEKAKKVAEEKAKIAEEKAQNKAFEVALLRNTIAQMIRENMLEHKYARDLWE